MAGNGAKDGLFRLGNLLFLCEEQKRTFAREGLVVIVAAITG